MRIDSADMDPADKRLVTRALDGDAGSVRTLVDALTPVIQVRVVRALRRSPVRSQRNRSARQEVEDLTQEVFVSLLADRGKALRAWEPERGLSLANFVGLLAQRQVASILRSGKRSPWTEDPADAAAIEAHAETEVAETRIESRELLARLLDKMREALSPRGLELFHRICVEQESVESIVTSTGMSAEAVYAWRSRLRRQVHAMAAELSAEGVGAPAGSDTGSGEPVSESPGSSRMPRRDVGP